MRPQVDISLNSKCPWFVSFQVASRDAGTDVSMYSKAAKHFVFRVIPLTKPSQA